MRMVLDTTAYVDFAEGREDVVTLLATRSSEILIPAVAVGELFYGFMKGNHPDYNEEKFREFLKSLDVFIIPVGQEAARKYAVIFLALIRKGTPIPIKDVWIAACCMAVGGTLLTRDQHFNQVDQIDKIILP